MDSVKGLSSKDILYKLPHLTALSSRNIGWRDTDIKHTDALI